ncbi:hypothetical protein [Nitrosospira sp. Is2]|uniref:hypothetical protein n=1 Tax=Nitrosospira sp. Is2 TaxID=3080532 RepID=UPI00295512D6|nr:hypothetical protein [Nitrosospira sp. Is2]WON74234.1 hypothetical protein R5L00_01725 [Nitrosospira sp. Is2]
MSLADLIKKRNIRKSAIANPANDANEKQATDESLAKLATLALASVGNNEASLRKVGASDTATTSHWWRFNYSNHELTEASYWPPVSEAEALEGEPEAISAEPFEPIPRQPDEPFSKDEEIEIREWLTYVGETDEAMIAVALEQCCTDADAREAFLRTAREKK